MSHEVRDVRVVLTAAGQDVVRRIEPNDALSVFCIMYGDGHFWFAWNTAPSRSVRSEDLGRDDQPPRRLHSPGYSAETMRQPHMLPDEPLTTALRQVHAWYRDTVRTAGPEEVGRLDAALIDEAVIALSQIAPALAAVQRTRDFIAFVQRLGHGPEEELVRRSVPSDRVNRLFPELAVGRVRERRLHRARTGGAASLVALGVSELEARPEERDAALLELVTAVLRREGEEAVGPLLALVEDAGRLPQFATDGSWTRHRQVVSWALRLLRQLPPQPRTRLSLIDLGRWVNAHGETHPRRPHVLGLHAALVARTLHALFPQEFPPPRVNGATNVVQNAEAFGFTMTSSEATRGGTTLAP